jgi:PAS domain S-box-containing protein
MSDAPQEPGAQAFDDAAFRALAEFSPDALIAHRDGKVLWANDAGGKLCGLASGTAMVGRQLMDFVAPESVEMVKERLQRVLDTGQRAPPIQYDLISVTGERVPVEGLELARSLRTEGLTTPIILCSGYSEALNEAKALAMGVSGVLAKPVDRDSMAAAVRRAIR